MAQYGPRKHQSVKIIYDIISLYWLINTNSYHLILSCDIIQYNETHFIIIILKRKIKIRKEIKDNKEENYDNEGSMLLINLINSSKIII